MNSSHEYEFEYTTHEGEKDTFTVWAVDAADAWKYAGDLKPGLGKFIKSIDGKPVEKES